MLQSVASALRHFGMIDGVLYLFNVASARVAGHALRIQRYHFIAQPLSIPLRAPRRVQASYETKVIAGEERVHVEFPRPSDIIEQRFKQGSVCIAAFRADELAGYIWVHAGPYDEDDVRCRYIPSPPTITSWDYDLFVSPAFRNSLAYFKIWMATVDYLLPQGIKWTLSRVSAFAPQSLAAHSRMGAIRIGSALFIDFRGIQLTFSSVAPYFHVSGKGKSGPTFVLNAPDS